MRRWFKVHSTRFMSFFISGFLSFITVLLLFLLISPGVLAADEDIVIPTSGNKISLAKPDISGQTPPSPRFSLIPLFTPQYYPSPTPYPLGTPLGTALGTPYPAPVMQYPQGIPYSQETPYLAPVMPYPQGITIHHIPRGYRIPRQRCILKECQILQHNYGHLGFPSHLFPAR